MKKGFFLKKTTVLVVLVAFSIYLTIPFTVVASPSAINIDGKVTVTNATTGQPIIQAGRTLVPIRIISENMGYKVDWNSSAQRVTISNSTTTIVLTIGKTNVTVNGIQKTIDVPATVRNGRTYVPLRFISENMGASCEWDSKTATVFINTKGGPIVVPPTVPVKEVKFIDVVTKSNVTSASLLERLTGNYTGGASPSNVKVYETSLTNGVPVGGYKIVDIAWANTNKIYAYALTDTKSSGTIEMALIKDGQVIKTLTGMQTTWPTGVQVIGFSVNSSDGTLAKEFDACDTLGFYRQGTSTLYVVDKPALRFDNFYNPSNK